MKKPKLNDEFKIITGFYFPESKYRKEEIVNFVEKSIEYNPTICRETKEPRNKETAIKISDNKYLEIIAYCQNQEYAEMITDLLNRSNLSKGEPDEKEKA